MDIHRSIREAREVFSQETAERQAEASKALDMNLEDFTRFHTLKSLYASIGGRAAENATIMYGYMSESVEKFNRQDAAVKLILTHIFAELLKLKIEGLI